MAQVDYFLYIKDVKGESQDSKHKEQIDVLSWSLGVTQTGSAAYGGGTGTGKSAFQDFTFTMKMSSASPKLLEACATGKPFSEAKLTCRKAGGKQEEYLIYTFSDLIISSYQTSGSGGNDVVPNEQIAFNYSKIKMEYHAQKPDGTLEGAINTGYDLKAIKVI